MASSAPPIHTSGLNTPHQRLPRFPSDTDKLSSDKVLEIVLGFEKSPGYMIEALQKIAPVLVRDYSKFGITDIDQFITKVEKASNEDAPKVPYFDWYRTTYAAAKKHCSDITKEYPVVNPRCETYDSEFGQQLWLDKQSVSSGKKTLRAAITKEIIGVKKCMEVLLGEMDKLEGFFARAQGLETIEKDRKAKVEDTPGASLATERVAKFNDISQFSLASITKKISEFETIRDEYFESIKSESQSGSEPDE